MRSGKKRIETGCSGGSGFDPVDKMVINQIMLRYRPIAPRPVTGERSVGFVPVKEKRVKRKYVRVKKNKKMRSEECNYINYTNLNMKDDERWREYVTDPVRKVSIPDQWISFDLSGNSQIRMTSVRPSLGLHDVDLAMSLTQRKLVESWITVESVIGSCENWDGEIWKDLEVDSCPGFISNGYNEVQWVNLAYRRMVDQIPENTGVSDPPEVVVWLVVKVEKSAFAHWSAFSCRVRVVYDRLSEKKKQMTVPCDVWKMDSGGYAWRLDVKAALSLGRLD